MKEDVVQFGLGQRLIGILTTAPRGLSDGPACLLMNAGVIHRIGPHRLNVKIARALAGCGISTLRFDLSGVGDSPAALGGANFSEQAVLDLQAAMDYLAAQRGVRRFVVCGLCSGAVHSYRLALTDDRVVGALMFDGFVYPTFKTHLLRRWRRLRSQSLMSLARKIPNWLSRQWSGARGAATVGDDDPSDPNRQRFEQDINRLVARGVAVYLIYSGTFLEHYNYPNQLRDAFPKAPFLEAVRHDYLPDVDHTVTSLASQRKVIAAVLQWVQSVAGQGGKGRRASSR